MARNRWNEYPKKKPAKDGWYQCSVRYGNEPGEAYVMDLFYYADKDIWRDNRRQGVFNIYEVYRPCKGPDGNAAMERIYHDHLCIRDDVIAWKNLPKIYR